MEVNERTEITYKGTMQIVGQKVKINQIFVSFNIDKFGIATP